MALPSLAPTLADGRYVLERKLGEGGHAAVYRVADTRLGVKRAAKIMTPEAARRKKLRERFDREARTMAGLDHPHVVRVFDVTDGPQPYLIMELVTGGSLAQWLDRHGPMPPRLACACVRQASLGVAAAHANGVVHRDIKPHNILVTAAGLCKLTDFGIARVDDDRRTKAGVAMGTEGYMAPEQARDAAAVDVRVDVFSLGMTLFVLLTGRDPLERLAGMGLDEVPEPLQPLIERATAFDRNRRQDSVASFVAELDAAMGALPADPEAASLAMPEVEGDELDLDQLTLLSQAAPTTDASALGPEPSTRRAPDPNALKALPYNIPKPAAERTDRTPEWVERGAAPDARRGFEVGLDEASLEATRKARAARAATPIPARPADVAITTAGDALGPEDAAEEAATFTQQILASLAGIVTDPWKMMAPAILLLLLLLAVPIVQGRRALDVGIDPNAAARNALMLRFERDRGGLDEVVALGGDGATLELLYTDWMRTRDEPAKTLALKRYVGALEHELEAKAVEGSASTDAARQKVAESRRALEEFEKKVAEAEASGRGCASAATAP